MGGILRRALYLYTRCVLVEYTLLYNDHFPNLILVFWESYINRDQAFFFSFLQITLKQHGLDFIRDKKCENEVTWKVPQITIRSLQALAAYCARKWLIASSSKAPKLCAPRIICDWQAGLLAENLCQTWNNDFRN